MSDLASIFDSESLEAFGPEPRARLEAAAALVRMEPGDCVIAHTETMSADTSARLTVWRAAEDGFVAEQISVASDGTVFAETTFETRDASGRPLSRRLEVDGRVERTDVWKYTSGTTRHVSDEPNVDARSVHVERATDRRITIDHSYREGPFRKSSTTDVTLDDSGRPVSIDVLTKERHFRIRCASTYAWAGLDATIDFRCDGEQDGQGVESRDDQGRVVSRKMVTGTGDNAWSSAYTWTWGTHGLIAAQRTVPFLGAAAEAWLRDETGRVVAKLDRGDSHRIVELVSSACPAEEPFVPRWTGDAP